jgi:DNA adenine methylase
MDASLDRPALRYHGSKWRLADWIIESFPPHECYVEPFGGGAGVLLQKPRSWLEVFNDLDGAVVNFFRVLRERPDELIRAIELTPYAREEWQQAMNEAPDDPLEAARRFYVRAYQNRAGPTATQGAGWRRNKVVTQAADGRKLSTPAAVAFTEIEHLYPVAGRLRGVQIEHDEALTIIKRYDGTGTLFYLDPPYPGSTRSPWARQVYSHEMTDAEHLALAKSLHGIQGMAVISGYRCELYDALYNDWERRDRETRINGPGSAIESLWISPAAAARRLPLLAYAEGLE